MSVQGRHDESAFGEDTRRGLPTVQGLGFGVCKPLSPNSLNSDPQA